MKTQLKVFLCSTFGNCEYNSYVSTQIGEFLKANDIQITATPLAADTIIINTCGVDSSREETATDIINDISTKFPAKNLIVTGCLTKISPEIIHNDTITKIPPRNLEQFDRIFNAEIPINTITPAKINTGYLRKGDNKTPSLHYIRISIGCTNNCAYCSIKKAKGAVISEPPQHIIQLFKNAVAAGETNISLLSDECGSYGADIGTNFAELLNQLISISQPETGIHIHYIDPAKLHNLHPHINPLAYTHIKSMNVPLQATSNRILHIMGRKNNTETTLETLRQIKTLNNKIALSTNIIYAFPGETPEEFEDTFRLKNHFDTVVYYNYSERPNTRAASFDGKIPEHERIRRTHRVIEESKKDPRIILAYEHLSEIGLDPHKPPPTLYIFKQ